MSRPNTIKHRKSAFERQRGRCCYCGFLMWQHSADDFAAKHRISLAQAKHFQCTAEHLQARCNGGKDSADNIAAACKRCNQLRHQRKKAPSPEGYQQFVQKRLSKGKWCSLPPKAKLERQKPRRLKSETDVTKDHA